MTALPTEAEQERTTPPTPRAVTSRTAPRNVQRPEIEVLLACGSVVGGVERTARIQAQLNAPFDWPALLALARPHGMLPLLHRHLVDGDPRVTRLVPDTVTGALRNAADELAQRNLYWLSRLVLIVRTLERDGIPVITFKGPTLAHVAYGSIAMRRFADLDVLVPTDRLPAAHMVLESIGFHRYPNDLTPLQQEVLDSCNKEWPFCSPRDGVQIEVHRQLSPVGEHPAMEYGSVAAHRTIVDVGNVSLPTLGYDDLIVYLCMHGAMHAWERFEWVCNLAAMLCHPEIGDGTAVLARARALHAERKLLAGLYLAQALCDAPLPTGISRANKVARTLADTARRRLTRSTERPPSTVAKMWYRVRAKSRLADMARQSWYWTTTPTIADLQFVPLRRRWFPLYLILRPIRLAWTHFLVPFASRKKPAFPRPAIRTR